MIRENPVVTAAAISGAVIALASVFGVVLDLSAVEAIVTAVLPILLSLIARAKVTPVG